MISEVITELLKKDEASNYLLLDFILDVNETSILLSNLDFTILDV